MKKKVFSKSMSWILSVVMIFGLFIIAPMTANASTGGHTQEEAVAWAQAQVGKYLDYDGAYGSQCVDLIAYYYQYLGNRTPGGNGCDYCRNALPSGWQRITNYSGYTPERGDICVWDSYAEYQGKYGHVGIVVGGDSSRINTIEQNIDGSPTKNFSRATAKVSCFIRPDFVSNTPVPHNDYEYMPLGEKYYLKNNGTGTYMSVDYGVDKQLQNISVYQFTGEAGQQYEIIGSDTDKSYFLRPVLCQSSGRVVNVNGEYTSAGANIMLYNYTGHSTQQWKFTPVSGGYAICSTNNPNCCLAESGTNVQMASYTGASNQTWTLEPVEHHHNYTEYVYNGSAHPHYKCYRCSCGEVMENRNEPTYVDSCADCIVESRADVGTDFYAYIINTYPWKMASVVVDEYSSVRLYGETALSNQFWYFERQSDRSYKITNVATGKLLDVSAGATDNGTDVCVWSDYNGDNQRWYLVEVNGNYVLHPKHAPVMALDVNGGSSDDGTNIQIWTTNHSAAQIFTIYRYDNNPVKPELTSSGTVVNKGENFTVSWAPCRFAHNYWIDVWHNDNHEQSFRWDDLSYTLDDLDTGHYTIYVKACNHNGVSDAVPVDFTVPDYGISPTAAGNYNGHRYEYYDQTMTWNQAYKFCEKKGGHLVTVTSKEENDFLVGLLENQPTDVWTGGRTFDAQTWFWITCEPFDFQNWNENQPDYYNNEEDSLEIYVVNGPIGTWNDLPQGNNTYCGFICEYENIDATKYTPVYKENYNGHEYWFFEDAVDWQTAKKICEGKGGYLAIPNGADENAFILSGVQKTSKEEAWLGITDIAQEGVWKNVKGSSISYSNWETDEPSGYLGIEDYVEMYPSGKWNDLRGFGASYRSVGFVCEFDSLCVLGHQYVDKYVAATDSENAHIIHKCSVCGYEWIESKTVSFETNGGTPVDSIDLLDQSVYGTLPVPTKDGYTFKGWSLTPVDTNSSVFTHDTAIYFKVPESWGNVQTVFCHLWSTEREDPIYKWQSEQEICENMGNGLYKYIIPSGTDANGVIFSAIEGYQTYDIALGTACENDVLYCVHQFSSYPYIYEGAWTVNKAFKSIPSSWYDGEDLVNGMIDPETLKIDGYRFVNADTEIKQTGDHTLYAIWEIKHYTISYNMNGGNGTISKQTKTHGKDLTLSATVPIRTDYIFVGWSTDKNTASATYQPGDKYTSNSNATLYAVWSANHHYSTKVIAPTCTEKGYTLHTCTVCGDSYKNTYTNALGHDYEEKIVAPTAASQGYTLYTCKRCGYSYKDHYTECLFANHTTLDTTSIEIGGSIHINASAEGGTAPYKFTVKFKKDSSQYWTLIQENSENKAVSFKPESIGVYAVSVTASDSNGKTETKTFEVTVNEKAAPLSIEAHVAETLVLGDTMTITAKGSGGTGGYTYGVYYKKTTSETWSTVQPITGTSAVITIKPTSAVKYDVCVKVRDTSRTIEKQYFTVTVVKKEVPLTNNSTISKTSIPLGESVTITAKATGGTGKYTYGVYYKKASVEKWTTAQSYNTNATVSIKPGAAVKYDVCVKVKDSNGTIVKQYFTVTVTKELVNSSTVSATTVKKGQSVTVTAKASGGTGKYTYGVYYKKATSETWTTAQSYGTNNTVTIKPGAAVKYNICVKVKDSSGKIAKKYIDITCTK